MKYSKNARAEELMGRRREGVISIDEPCELGYRCPVCLNSPGPNAEGQYDERLHWSEYNSFLWCEVCNRDYPSCLCMPDAARATETFLASVEDAVKHKSQSRQKWRHIVGTLHFAFAWYDLWMGAYYDRKAKVVYICPLPCCVFRFGGG